jgi:hypothetical protein
MEIYFYDNKKRIIPISIINNPDSNHTRQMQIQQKLTKTSTNNWYSMEPSNVIQSNKKKKEKKKKRRRTKKEVPNTITTLTS